eukprot:743876-Pleurochrysis_carterae.AAC.1
MPKSSRRCGRALADGSPRRRARSSTSARSTLPSTPSRGAPEFGAKFGSGSMRSSTARRRSLLTTSFWAPSRTCWRSEVLATTSSSLMRPSPSASCRPAACAPGSRRRPNLVPRLTGSCATQSSPVLAP